VAAPLFIQKEIFKFMSEVIATVRLAPGQVGYYDELSRIHLTIGMPEKAIYAGTNVTQLRRSVKSGRLILVNGTFGEERPPFKLVRKGDRYYLAHNKSDSKKQPEVAVPTKAEEVAPVVEEKAAPVEEVAVEEPVVEEAPAEVEETPAAEEAPAVEETPAVEEAPAEEEAPKKKKTTRKKTAKKAE